MLQLRALGAALILVAACVWPPSPTWAASPASSLTADPPELPKIGKADPTWFGANPHAADSAVHAYVIAQRTGVDLDYRSGGFSMRQRVRRIVRVLDAQGRRHAVVRIRYYDPEDGGGEVRLRNFEAYTYHADGADGIPVEASEIFETRLTQLYSERSFSFPRVEDGSVLDLTFELVSPYTDVAPARLQESIPMQDVHYELRANGAFDIATTVGGYYPVESGRREEPPRNRAMPAQDVIRTFSARDVPPVRPEVYTAALEHYAAHVAFEIKAVHGGNGVTYPLSGSWRKVAERLTDYAEMRAALRGKNAAERHVAAGRQAREAGGDPVEGVRASVAGSLTYTGRRTLFASEKLKDTDAAGEGHAADVNLAVLAALRALDLEAFPAFIATRDYGRVVAQLPAAGSLNKMIVAVREGSGYRFVDATAPGTAAGVLPVEDYNGLALVALGGDDFELADTQARAASQVGVQATLALGDDGLLAGEVKLTLAGPMVAERVEVAGTRRSLRVEDLDLTPGYELDVRSATEVAPGRWVVEGRLTSTAPAVDLGGALAFSPVIGGFRQNQPFTAETRTYPVELPYRVIETRSVTITLPEGFAVESVPEPLSASTSDRQCVYRYQVSPTAEGLTLSTTFASKGLLHLPAAYPELRGVYALAAEREGELVSVVAAP